MRPRRAERVLLFLAPLTRGGRGGCPYGVSLSRGLPFPTQGLFQQLPQGGSRIWRAPIVGFFNNSSSIAFDSRRRSSLTLSSRRRRRIEGRGESNASRWGRGHPSIRGFTATQDEAERGFSTTPLKAVVPKGASHRNPRIAIIPYSAKTRPVVEIRAAIRNGWFHMGEHILHAVGGVAA